MDVTEHGELFMNIKYLVAVLAMVISVTGCRYIEEKRAEALGEPVLLDDGSVRLYSKGGTLAVDGIATVIFPEESFSQPTVVRLERVATAPLAERIGDGYEPAGYAVRLEIEADRVALEPYEVIVGKGSDTVVIGLYDWGMEVYDNRVTASEQGVFAVCKVLVTEEGIEPVIDDDAHMTEEVASEPSVSEENPLDVPDESIEDSAAEEEIIVEPAETPAEEKASDAPWEGFSGIVQTLSDGSTLRFVDPGLGVSFEYGGVSGMVPGGLRPSEPMVVTTRTDGIFLQTLGSDRTLNILSGSSLSVKSLLWSEDGRALAIALFDDSDQLSGLWMYDVMADSVTKLSGGNIDTMGWSQDGRQLIFGEKNKRDDGTHALMVKLGDRDGNVSIIYGVLADEGDASIINGYSSQTRNQAYATASIRDGNLGDVTIGLIYDYATGNYTPLMNANDLYQSYMSNFALSPEIVESYSGLEQWHLPEVHYRNGMGWIITYKDQSRYYSLEEGETAYQLDSASHSCWVEWHQ